MTLVNNFCCGCKKDPHREYKKNMNPRSISRKRAGPPIRGVEAVSHLSVKNHATNLAFFRLRTGHLIPPSVTYPRVILLADVQMLCEWINLLFSKEEVVNVLFDHQKMAVVNAQMDAVAITNYPKQINPHLHFVAVK